MMKFTLFASLYLCFILLALPVAAQNPFEEAVLNQYDGVFVNEDIVLVLENQDLAYIGQIDLKGKRFPVQGRIVEGVLEAGFHVEDERYEFKLQYSKDGAVYYSASGHVAQLKKQSPMDLTKVWATANEELKVSFKNKESGQLLFREKTYDFHIKHGRVILYGVFKVRENEFYAFKITPHRNGSAWFTSSVYQKMIYVQKVAKEKSEAKSGNSSE